MTNRDGRPATMPEEDDDEAARSQLPIATRHKRQASLSTKNRWQRVKPKKLLVAATRKRLSPQQPIERYLSLRW